MLQAHMRAKTLTVCKLHKYAAEGFLPISRMCKAGALKEWIWCMCLLMSCSQQWNLVEFLPRALHQPMQLLLAEWMYLPWQEANKAAAAARGASQGGSQAALDTRQAEQIQVQGRPPWCRWRCRASGDGHATEGPVHPPLVDKNSTWDLLARLVGAISVKQRGCLVSSCQSHWPPRPCSARCLECRLNTCVVLCLVVGATR
jgi:hypothetical protein